MRTLAMVVLVGGWLASAGLLGACGDQPAGLVAQDMSRADQPSPPADQPSDRGPLSDALLGDLADRAGADLADGAAPDLPTTVPTSGVIEPGVYRELVAIEAPPAPDN